MDDLFHHLELQLWSFLGMSFREHACMVWGKVSNNHFNFKQGQCLYFLVKHLFCIRTKLNNLRNLFSTS